MVHVAVTMKISEYADLIYNFQTGIANWSIVVKKHCFLKSKSNISLDRELYNTKFIIYNFITLESISTATTIIEYCKIAHASNMFI